MVPALAWVRDAERTSLRSSTWQLSLGEARRRQEAEKGIPVVPSSSSACQKPRPKLLIGVAIQSLLSSRWEGDNQVTELPKANHGLLH